MLMKNRLPSLAIAISALFAFAAPAAALTVSNSDTTTTPGWTIPVDVWGDFTDEHPALSLGAAPNLTLDRFDPSLGTLTGVELRFDHTASGEATASRTVGDAVDLTFPFAFEVTSIDNGAPGTAAAAVALDPTFVGNVPAGTLLMESALSTSLFWTSPVDLASFEGTGTFVVDPWYEIVVTPPANNCPRGQTCPDPPVGENDLANPTATTVATVIYTYSVPEPSTAALLGLALTMVAAGARTRRS